MAVADLNGDGKPDLVLSFYGGNEIVLLGNGDGTFRGPQPFAGGPYPAPPPVTVADFNGDGVPDKVYSYFSAVDRGISVLLGNGDSTFQNPLKLSNYFPDVVSVADLNGDGKPDIVTAKEEAQRERIHQHGSGLHDRKLHANGTYRRRPECDPSPGQSKFTADRHRHDEPGPCGRLHLHARLGRRHDSADYQRNRQQRQRNTGVPHLRRGWFLSGFCYGYRYEWGRQLRRNRSRRAHQPWR